MTTNTWLEDDLEIPQEDSKNHDANTKPEVQTD